MKRDRIPVGEWHDYVTTRRHGKYKAGTKCKVSRDAEGRLVLKFGRVFMTLTMKDYAMGIEYTTTEFALAW